MTIVVGECSSFIPWMEKIMSSLVFFASNTLNVRVDMWQESLLIHGFRMHVCGDFNNNLKFGDTS